VRTTATEKQITLIEQLLDELSWDRGQLAVYDPAWERYEDLDVRVASELIDFLIEEKRAQGEVE